MQQIILIISAISLGLVFGNLTGGLTFSAAVCLIAGIFLVTPSLFKFQLSDFAILKNNMPSVYKNLWINYLLVVVVALIIGYIMQDIGIAAALFLLALLPGGGMVMMWIKQSGANVKLGFLIFILNLALLLPITLIFGLFDNVASSFFPTPDLTIPEHMQGAGKKIMPIAPFIILVVIPFLLSRVILKFFPNMVKFVGKHQQFISKSTMFGIVLYLFSLSTAQLLFQVDIMNLIKATIATSIFYGIVFFIAEKLTDNSANGKALYWHIATRYITLALILSVFSVETYGATFILPIMIAYFIQIGFAGFLSKRQIMRMKENS